MKILAIIWKDTILRFTSKTELLFFLVLPLFFTFILSGGTGPQGYDNRIRLLVVDQAGSSLSGSIVAALEASDTVNPDLMTLEDAESAFEDRDASTLLIIPAGCDLAALETGEIVLDLRQLPNNLDAQAVARTIQTVLFRLGSAVSIARDAVAQAESYRPLSDAERQDIFDASLAAASEEIESAPVRLQSVLGGTPDPVEYDQRANSSAGQLITWVFIPLIGISASFAYERQRGTLRRLLTTPTGRGTYLLGTIFGFMFWALVQVLLLVLFGTYVLHVSWTSHPAALALVMVAACLAAASLGTMLGTFVKTEGQASGLSIMFGMVMALLGGCWYPLELFPQVVQQVVKVLPTTWAMRAMLDLSLRGQGVLGVLPEAGVLFAFAVIFLLVGIWRFRYE